MKLFSIIKFVINHPLNRDHKLTAVFRFFKWQISSYLNPYSIIYPFTEKSKLIINKGMTGATGNLYCGLHEYYDMFFLLHFLRKDDLFIDIGANIGSYTILSAAHIKANTISIEPIPSTFSHLINNININQIQEKVQALNIALGSMSGKISFTKSLDTMNHVAVNSDKETIEVDVLTLDEIIGEGRTPALIKIDVEGFETEVIKGASKTLLKEELKAIIIELNGAGTRFGYDEKEIHNKLTQIGFSPCYYNPTQRSFNIIETFGKFNTIYIRDFDFVSKRLISAEKVKMYNKNI